MQQIYYFILAVVGLVSLITGLVFTIIKRMELEHDRKEKELERAQKEKRLENNGEKKNGENEFCLAHATDIAGMQNQLKSLGHFINDVDRRQVRSDGVTAEQLKELMNLVSGLLAKMEIVLKANGL